MKLCSAALQSHLQQASTSTAYLWLVTRVDGTQLAYTTHDQAIILNGITYLASTGLSNTARSSREDLSVDNMEIAGFLDSPSITETDIRAGLYDNATVQLALVNWADLTMGAVLLGQGTLGVVKMKNGMFHAEIRGISYKLTAQIGALYGPICRATFGSGLNGIDMNSHYLCMFNVTTVRQTGSIASVTALNALVPTSGLTGQGGSTGTASAGWFNDGFLTFTSGVLNEVSAEIKSWDGTTLTLFLALPQAPAPGDTFTIEAGCAKTTADCQGKFSNIVNFQGEPFIPGMDQLLDYVSG